jgi:hypothetical protein
MFLGKCSHLRRPYIISVLVSERMILLLKDTDKENPTFCLSVAIGRDLGFSPPASTLPQPHMQGLQGCTLR